LQEIPGAKAFLGGSAGVGKRGSMFDKRGCEGDENVTVLGILLRQVLKKRQGF
jgi:hypothetical protein